MYPANFFSLFPAFPVQNTCFVAMSFAPQFSNRWQKVIDPAIRNVLVNDAPLLPIRVDQKTINDSILTEILMGIGRCRVMFADVTTMGMINGRAFRNDNVMYEVGIAHARRQPPEVVLFRSDSDQLLFDLANVRVNSYDPDRNPGGAFQAVQEALLSALKEVELWKNLAVERAAEALDASAWGMLDSIRTTMMAHPTDFRHEVLMWRVIGMGLIEVKQEPVTVDTLRAVPDFQHHRFITYGLTPFGLAVLQHREIKLELPMLVTRLREAGRNPDGTLIVSAPPATSAESTGTAEIRET